VASGSQYSPVAKRQTHEYITFKELFEAESFLAECLDAYRRFGEEVATQASRGTWRLAVTFWLSPRLSQI